LRRLLAPFSLVTLAGIALAGTLGAPPTDAAPVDVDTQVLRIVSGIVGYSRWPTPPTSLRFCIAGNPAHLKDPPGKLGQIGEHAISYRRLDNNDPDSAIACDILYLGNMLAAERKRLQDKAVGRPILSISEDDALCAEASMFCLPILNGEVGLRANLDVISRSGIRINPKVLQLVQRRKNQHESN